MEPWHINVIKLPADYSYKVDSLLSGKMVNNGSMVRIPSAVNMGMNERPVEALVRITVDIPITAQACVPTL